ERQGIAVTVNRHTAHCPIRGATHVTGLEEFKSHFRKRDVTGRTVRVLCKVSAEPQVCSGNAWTGSDDVHITGIRGLGRFLVYGNRDRRSGGGIVGVNTFEIDWIDPGHN